MVSGVSVQVSEFRRQRSDDRRRMTKLEDDVHHLSSVFCLLTSDTDLPRRRTARIAGMISNRQRPGSEFRDQGHNHPGKRTKGAALNDFRLLQASCNLSRLRWQLAHRSPGYGRIT